MENEKQDIKQEDDNDIARACDTFLNWVKNNDNPCNHDVQENCNESKIITHFSTLMIYAKEEAEARKSGNLEEIEKASKKHEDYRQLCLKSDSMIIPKYI